MFPCGHCFCGGCLSEWTKKHTICPHCADSIEFVKRSMHVNNAVEILHKTVGGKIGNDKVNRFKGNQKYPIKKIRKKK